MKSKNIILTLQALAVMSGLIACDSDIKPIYVYPSDEVTLGGADGDIILTADNPEALVLSLYWTGDGKLSLSNPNYSAPVNTAKQILQLSSDENFTNVVEITLDNDARSYQFLSQELNALLGRLGYEDGVLSPLWIRVRSELAANVEPTYSSVLNVQVSAYRISLKLGFVLNSDMTETTMALASPTENGIYTGFMGVPGWYNWFFREGNNIVWGNLGESNRVFYASSDESHWNFWFPDPSGCYYTTVNTVEGWWSALHIDNITVSGDFSGDMTFNQKTNQWTLDLNSPSATTASIKLSGAGSLYDKETTDMGPAESKSIGFSGDSQSLIFGDNASSVSVAVPAGQTTLILDLSDPLQNKVYTGEAAVAPEPEVAEYLYYSGFDDGEGSWEINDHLTLYSETGKSYAGVQMADCAWGWLIYQDTDWSGSIGLDSGDAYSGTLKEGWDNIPAPAPGRYLIDVSLGAMTYSLSEINDVWYTGLNDDWSLSPMTLVEGCIYQAEVTKSAPTPWGVKIVLRDDWSMWFGGADGILRYGWDGFNGDNDLENGTYILTVDLAKGTYTYTAK